MSERDDNLRAQDLSLRKVEEPRRGLGERFGRALDGLAGVVSPRWGYARSAYREAQKLARRAAEWRRTDPTRRARSFGKYEVAAQAGEAQDMCARARQLEEDSVLAAAVLQRSVENIVGTGLVVQAQTGDDGWNQAAEDLLAETFLLPGQCETTGGLSWPELQSTVLTCWERDGDVGLITINDGDDAGKLQLVESPDVITPAGKGAEQRIYAGIQVDGRMRPAGYYVRDGDDGTGRRTKWIPAEDILFLKNARRPKHVRGETLFAQSFPLFEQVPDYIEAEVIAARIAACFGAVIKKRDNKWRQGLPTATTADDKTVRKYQLEPGGFYHLRDDEDVEQLKPEHPPTGLREFVTLLARLAGLPFCLPLEMVLLDVSQTSYSSIRAGLLQAQRRFRRVQAYLRDHLVLPVWRWKVDEWVRAGRLTERKDLYKCRVVLPGWPWVDPVAEVQAYLLACDAGLDSPEGVAFQLGRDPDEVIKALKRWRDKMAAAEIPLMHSNMTRDEKPAASAGGKGGAAKQGGDQ